VVLDDLRRRLRSTTGVTYEESRELARHGDSEVRRQLASRTDIRPEVLYFLADDTSADVRREIATNTSSPRKADLKLASDADPEVRSELAVKIARLVPGLTANERDSVGRMTYEVLELLARDEITRVRQVLAEALKDVADAPPEVIRRLARDIELVVSMPVLEFSPVLTDDDLIEIIASHPASGALSAISRRDPVNEPVSEAIVDTHDVDAVAQLLGNPSAQIRERTLDLLIEESVERPSWQEPLVRRPRLPEKAARRLAQMVAESLLDVLSQRDDLPASTVEAVRTEVHRRLDKKGAIEEEGPEQLARRLHRERKLNEKVIAESLRKGSHDFVAAAISVRAGLPAQTVAKAVESKSAKGIVALMWKAGLSMSLAVDVQKRVAKVPLTLVLKPTDSGGFPLRDDEMEWQLEFLSDLTG